MQGFNFSCDFLNIYGGIPKLEIVNTSQNIWTKIFLSKKCTIEAMILNKVMLKQHYFQCNVNCRNQNESSTLEELLYGSLEGI
jgi:hypothetical protein